MVMLRRRSWLSPASNDLVDSTAGLVASAQTTRQGATSIADKLDRLVAESRRVHELEGINLNPASNVMNPRAEAMLSAGLGTRASLGHPGDKYEMGLEAIERIEIIAAELTAQVFDAPYVELRVGSGALANLYVFMATCRPGDTIIAPPPEIGGHVTHHAAGAAGLYGVRTVPAPVDADGYTVNIDALRTLAHAERPKLITIGGSLNLFPHPVADVRAIADEVGAIVMFDAAHQSGMIAGRVWPNPLLLGAHVMTMSTYKSLGGPPGGLLAIADAGLAERIDAIAYPGLTANFDVGKTAALAIGLLDWKVYGADYAVAMQATARALADALVAKGLPVFARERGCTMSHQLAVEAADWGGGQAAAKRMRSANLLACGIGLPRLLVGDVDGDVNGLRLGVPEIVRRGMGPSDMPELASLIARSLADDGGSAAADVAAFSARFGGPLKHVL